MMMRKTVGGGAILGALAFSLSAQEPKPVRILASYLSQDGGVDLDFAWRFLAGDGVGFQSPQLDDSHWVPVKPQLTEADLAPAQWLGVGWVRRPLVIDPSPQGRPLAPRLAST